MDAMSEESRRRYRALVYEDAGFQAYFQQATPIEEIAQLNTGSRPVSRGGNGLINMRRRLQSIGAEFALETERGRGTKVLFRVPLKGGDQ